MKKSNFLLHQISSLYPVGFCKPPRPVAENPLPLTFLRVKKTFPFMGSGLPISTYVHLRSCSHILTTVKSLLVSSWQPSCRIGKLLLALSFCHFLSCFLSRLKPWSLSLSSQVSAPVTWWPWAPPDGLIPIFQCQSVIRESRTWK